MSGALLQPGETIAERYRVERLIGAGGYARVYRALDLGLDRPVALKLLTLNTHEGLSTPESVRKRFYREARLISKIQDPRTVTIYEYDVLDDGQLYMALEFIDGVNLASLIKNRGALAPERIERLLTQILLGLRAAHVQGVLHRDVKPSNVMVYDRYGEPDCVKLLDFGIAKAVMAEAEQAMGQDLTVEGAVVGTPRYMSPEQLLGKPLTAATDLFSTGLLLYEMVVGRSPFDTHDRTEIFRRMQAFKHGLGPLEEAPKPLSTIAAGLLAPSLDDRYQSAEDVLDILLGSSPAPGSAARERAAAPAGGGRATGGGRVAHSAPAPRHSTPSSPRHSSSTPITFPLGLDPAGATPSTELTGIGIAEQTTAILDISQKKLSADKSVEGAKEVVGRPGGASSLSVEQRPEEDVISTQSLVLMALDKPNRGKLVVAALIVVALALAGWGVYELSQTPEEAPREPAEPVPAEGRAAPVEPNEAAVSLQAAAQSLAEARTQAAQAAAKAVDETPAPEAAKRDEPSASREAPKTRKRTRTKRKPRPRRKTKRSPEPSKQDDPPEAPKFEIEPFE